MRLGSHEHSDSFSDSGFQLFVKLVNTNSITKVEDIFIFTLASEHNCDVEGNKDVVIGWTGSHWEPIDNVLLRHQELNLGPRHTIDETTLLFDVVKFAVLRDHSVSTFRHI